MEGAGYLQHMRSHTLPIHVCPAQHGSDVVLGSQLAHAPRQVVGGGVGAGVGSLVGGASVGRFVGGAD